MSNVKIQSGSAGSNLQKGFTLVELIVAMSIMATLVGLITINLSYSERKTTLASWVQTLIADVRQQQIKAMIGDSQGRPTPDSYGIHLDTDQYVLFHGITYSPEESSNSKISLPQNLQFVNSGTDIIFAKISGEISSLSIIQLRDTTNSNTRTIRLNRYGVIAGVN